MRKWPEVSLTAVCRAGGRWQGDALHGLSAGCSHMGSHASVRAGSIGLGPSVSEVMSLSVYSFQRQTQHPDTPRAGRPLDGMHCALSRPTGQWLLSLLHTRQMGAQTQICLLGYDRLGFYIPAITRKSFLLLRLRSTCVNFWLCHLPILS